MLLHNRSRMLKISELIHLEEFVQYFTVASNFEIDFCWFVFVDDLDSTTIDEFDDLFFPAQMIDFVFFVCVCVFFIRSFWFC